MSKRPAAFFDLDRTLIDVNSAVLFAEYERKAKRISKVQFLGVLRDSLLYHFNFLDMESAYNSAIKHYGGLEEALVEARTVEFFEAKIKSRLQPGAKLALDRHKELGHPLVMLTTSSSFQAKIASATWGFDAWLANRFPIIDGKLQGAVQSPLCYGNGKVIYAREWADENDVDLKASYFYSDSYSDLPMLSEVGTPVVVNPDPKLKAHAVKKGWQIVDWSKLH
jgi:HAD superfamily hydrolase (TIGR01490 family)